MRPVACPAAQIPCSRPASYCQVSVPPMPAFNSECTAKADSKRNRSHFVAYSDDKALGLVPCMCRNECRPALLMPLCSSCKLNCDSLTANAAFPVGAPLRFPRLRSSLAFQPSQHTCKLSNPPQNHPPLMNGPYACRLRITRHPVCVPGGFGLLRAATSCAAGAAGSCGGPGSCSYGEAERATGASSRAAAPGVRLSDRGFLGGAVVAPGANLLS